MAFTHRYTFSVSIGSINLSRTVALQNEAEDNRSIIVPGGAHNEVIALAFPVPGLSAIYVVSDINMTLEFVDATTFPVVLDLLAGEPIVWYTGVGYDLFAHSVTSCLASNANTDDANLEIRVLKDATP